MSGVTDAPAFSRSGQSNPLGKNDIRIETVLPQQIADDLLVVATLHRKTRSEWLRDLIMGHLYGELEAVRLRAGMSAGNTENVE